jgi:hypothetical protein
MQLFTRVRSALAAFAALTVALFLTGCLQVEQLIKVKPDGSGTITLTVVMTKEAIALMKQGAGGGAGNPLDEMANEDKAKEQAKKLGEGVTFEKIEKIKNDVGEGARTVYRFTDITKVKANMEMEDGPGGGGDKDGIAFAFTKGSPAKLVVNISHKKAEGGNDAPDADLGASPEAAQMMKGMKMTMALEVEGTITDTDAAHRAGSRVTLAEIPFDEIIKDPAKFKAMSKAKAWVDQLTLLKGVAGVKVEPKETVTVQFK